MASKEQLIKVYEYALNQEQTGMSFFKASLERMGIGAAVEAFHKLIKEEERHIAFIEGILKNLREEGEVAVPVIENSLKLEETDFFDQRAEAEFLQQCVEGSMIPDVTVFNTAWLIEKDLSEFYASMAAATQGTVRESFEMLSRLGACPRGFFLRSFETS